MSPSPIKLFTSLQVAEQLGCARDTVSRIAREHDLGQQFGRAFLYTDDDIAMLRGIIQDSPGWKKGVPRRV